jgi:hypothetical protein
VSCAEVAEAPSTLIESNAAQLARVGRESGLYVCYILKDDYNL